MTAHSVRKPGRPRQPALAKAPVGECRQLTSREVRHERVALGIDMIALVIQDGHTLPPNLRQELRTLHQGLLRLHRELRSLP